MAQHTVRTTHIQRLIENGLRLARDLDNAKSGPAEHAPGQSWRVNVYDEHGGVRTVLPEHALQKAAADLRHAAEELEAERLSCLGWPQV